VIFEGGIEDVQEVLDK